MFPSLSCSYDDVQRVVSQSVNGGNYQELPLKDSWHSPHPDSWNIEMNSTLGSILGHSKDDGAVNWKEPGCPNSSSFSFFLFPFPFLLLLLLFIF
jgi:hypothetical protein